MGDSSWKTWMLHVHICRDNHTRADGITTSCNREADLDIARCHFIPSR